MRTPLTADRLIALLALVLSVLSLGWQVTDAVMRRSESIAFSQAPSILGPPGGWKAATNGKMAFQFYLSNIGESPVNVLEIKPDSLFSASEALPKKLEPGETMLIKSITFEVSRKGLLRFDEFVFEADFLEGQSERLSVRTAKGWRHFDVVMRQQLTNSISFEEGVGRDVEKLKNAP